MAFKDLTPHERIIAVHTDIMRHKDFTLLGGVTQIGKVVIDDSCSTAGTDGRDVYYNTAFIMGMSRQQLRYLVAHENFHKALHHCTAYTSVVEKYKHASNVAMDYVINLMIEDLDAGAGWVARPTNPEPLVDVKYRDMSFLQVLQDLLKNPPPQGGQGGGQPGSGQPGQPGGTLDTHTQSKPGSGDPGAMTEEEGKALKQALTDAINQGQIVRDKLRGQGAGGGPVGGFQERTTDWRKPLKELLTAHVEGDEQSRFSPPNKRMLPLGILLPSHFSEGLGPVVIAVDTSGSISGIIGTVLGEVARICTLTQPESALVIWWDSAVAGVQTFTRKDYANMGKALKPVGGGGTTCSVVADYLEEHKIKARVVVYITDGYVESRPRTPKCPCVWAVVDNTQWIPPKGKVLRINSTEEACRN